MPFLRGEAQIDCHNATFGQVYNDQSDGIAGGDQLNIQSMKQLGVGLHLQPVFDEASRSPTARSKCQIHANKRRTQDSLAPPQQPSRI